MKKYTFLALLLLTGLFSKKTAYAQPEKELYILSADTVYQLNAWHTDSTGKKAFFPYTLYIDTRLLDLDTGMIRDWLQDLLQIKRFRYQDFTQASKADSIQSAPLSFCHQFYNKDKNVLDLDMKGSCTIGDKDVQAPVKTVSFSRIIFSHNSKQAILYAMFTYKTPKRTDLSYCFYFKKEKGKWKLEQVATDNLQ